ncbi:hypothetical protein M8J75_010920 [Diaphorina citri]|nr:hypothetical protein M8J75_010920 [Diaphorina citri]
MEKTSRHIKPHRCGKRKILWEKHSQVRLVQRAGTAVVCRTCGIRHDVRLRRTPIYRSSVQRMVYEYGDRMSGPVRYEAV